MLLQLNRAHGKCPALPRATHSESTRIVSWIELQNSVQVDICAVSLGNVSAGRCLVLLRTWPGVITDHQEQGQHSGSLQDVPKHGSEVLSLFRPTTH